MEALRLYTAENGGYTHEEDRLGTIEPGKLGDLAVLTEDYFDAKKVPDEALAGIAKVNDGLAEQMKAVRNARKKRPAAMRATHAKSPEIPGGHAR